VAGGRWTVIPLPDYDAEGNEIPLRYWRVTARFEGRREPGVDWYWATTAEGATEQWEFEAMGLGLDADAAQCELQEFDPETDKPMGVSTRFNSADRTALIERLAHESQGGGL
jgi:hypothetical protein